MKLRTSITQAHDIPDEQTERQDLQCQISTHIGSQTRTDFETYTVTNRHKYLETLLHLNSFLCRPTTAPFYLFSLTSVFRLLGDQCDLMARLLVQYLAIYNN